MKILFTGSSSFTGYWFVRRLVEAGHEVVAAIRGARDHYEGIRAQRVNRVVALCRTEFECPFGTPAFFDLIQREGPWDLLCHHAADVTDYRSPQFDVMNALSSNVHRFPEMATVLKNHGCHRLLLTGSVFEQYEGLGTNPGSAVSAYGLSKGLTSDFIRFYCERESMSFGKFVIPNPFGPFEEPRLTSHLMHTWAKGEIASIKTPSYVRDNIHVDLLADVYATFAQQLSTDAPYQHCAPSGYVEQQAAFVGRFAKEMRQRMGLACLFECHQQDSFPEPRVRVNSQPAMSLVNGWDEVSAWDGIATYYNQLLGKEQTA